MENNRLQGALDKLSRGKQQMLYSDKKDGDSGYELYLDAMRDLVDLSNKYKSTAKGKGPKEIIANANTVGSMIDRKIVECNAQIQELKAKIDETRAKSKGKKSEANKPNQKTSKNSNDHYQTMFLSQQPKKDPGLQETMVVRSEDFGLNVNVAKPAKKFFSPMMVEDLSPLSSNKIQKQASPDCPIIKPIKDQGSGIARPKLSYNFVAPKKEEKAFLLSELDGGPKEKVLFESELPKDGWAYNSKETESNAGSGFIDDYLGKMKSKIDNFQSEFEKYQKKMQKNPSTSDKIEAPKQPSKVLEKTPENPLEKTLKGKDGKFSFANIVEESPNIDLGKLQNLEATMSKFVEPEVKFDPKNCLHYFIDAGSDQVVPFGTIVMKPQEIPKPQHFIDPIAGQMVMFETGPLKL